MDTTNGEVVVSFLTLRERRELLAVSRRWLFTCKWLQFAASEVHPKKSVWNFHSRAFRHVWQTFIRHECHSFLPPLLELLPAAVIAETMELNKGLCLSTNTGQRPSFENAHARSGYIQQKINRCGNLPNLLLTDELSELRSELFRVEQPECWNMALYGGGPGFDALGLVFKREYFRAWNVNFHTTVYDNEPGWECAIDAVGQTLVQLGQRNASLSFQHCDIALDVDAAENNQVAKSLTTIQLHVFSFVCVENFCLLRDSALDAPTVARHLRRGQHHRPRPVPRLDAVRSQLPFRTRAADAAEKVPVHSKPASTFPFYMAKLQDFRAHQQKHLKTMAKLNFM